MPQRNRQREIMQAAERLFATRRIHEITLDDVIAEAGVGKGTVYRYFRDKDDLFFQTALHGFDDLCALVQAARGEGEPFETRLLTACERISEFFRRRRPLFRMMNTEEFRLPRRSELSQQWKARRQTVTAALAAVLARGAAERMVRPDIPPDVLACVLMGMLRTRARELNEAGGEAAGLPVIVGLFLRGARANGGIRRQPPGKAQSAAVPPPQPAAKPARRNVSAGGNA